MDDPQPLPELLEPTATPEPLPLEEVTRYSGAVSREQAELIRKLYGLLEVNEAALEIIAEIQNPWRAVARMTQRSEPRAQAWTLARESRIACRRASDAQWREIKSSGLWPVTLGYWMRRSRVSLSIARLYFAASLYSIGLVGFVNLRHDEELIAAWCK